MPLNPGMLRHRVTLSTTTRVANGSGGYVTTISPTPFATVWARVNPLEGEERIQAMQTTANASHEVTLRYLAGVTTKMLVGHDGRTFDIVAPPIDSEERHEALTLLCRERV